VWVDVWWQWGILDFQYDQPSLNPPPPLSRHRLCPRSLRHKYSKLSTDATDDFYDDDEGYTKKPQREIRTSRSHPKKYEIMDDWDGDENEAGWDEDEDDDEIHGEELERTAFMDKNKFTDVKF
jgi:hypothetical protein